VSQVVVSAQQVQAPEFNPQYHQKEKKRKRKKNLMRIYLLYLPSGSSFFFLEKHLELSQHHPFSLNTTL
jgi:hypothetical protein